MKKTALLFLILPGILNAQGFDKKIEIEASYGLLSSAQLRSITEEVALAVFSLGTATQREDFKFTGPVFITGKYYVAEWLALGATFGIDNIKADLVDDDVVVGEYSYPTRVAAAELKFRYLNRGLFQLYSGLSSGVRFGDEKNAVPNEDPDVQSRTRWTAQLNLLGIRVGKGFGGFIESGFGYKGILNFGLSYQF